MLMVERTVRFIYGDALRDTKMPRKNEMTVIAYPNPRPPVGIWWTDRKSDEGKRLFNVGAIRPDGSTPPLFQH